MNKEQMKFVLGKLSEALATKFMGHRYYQGAFYQMKEHLASEEMLNECMAAYSHIVKFPPDPKAEQAASAAASSSSEKNAAS